MEKLVYKNSYNLFLLKPSSKVSTQKVSLKVYKKLLKVKFFCIFLPSNQKLALKYCIFIKIDSIFFNFIPISFDKFFRTGKFEVKSHIVQWREDNNKSGWFLAFLVKMSLSEIKRFDNFFIHKIWQKRCKYIDKVGLSPLSGERTTTKVVDSWHFW